MNNKTKAIINKEKSKKPEGFFKFTKKYYKKFKPYFFGMILLVFLSSFLRVIQPKILSELLKSVYSGGA